MSERPGLAESDRATPHDKVRGRENWCKRKESHLHSSAARMVRLRARFLKDHNSSSRKNLIKLDREERNLIRSNDLCRMATTSSSGWPHCVPVSYVFQNGLFHVPANRGSRKVRNLERDSKATLLIDEREHREYGLMIECSSTILYDRSAIRMREYMRRVKGWQNDENTVIIQLKPLRKASWFRE